MTYDRIRTKRGRNAVVEIGGLKTDLKMFVKHCSVHNAQVSPCVSMLYIINGLNPKFINVYINVLLERTFWSTPSVSIKTCIVFLVGGIRTLDQFKLHADCQFLICPLLSKAGACDLSFKL